MMVTAKAQPRVLLLIEDNPADADLVEELLEQAHGERYKILRATRISDAVEKLNNNHVDVVLLDLRLPDGTGITTLQSIRNANQEIPIVVLTGSDDEVLATSCINAGAQDYLCKGEIRPASLRRSIGYAITRIRERQFHAMQETLTRYRGLSNETSLTSVTAALAGTGAVRERHGGLFTELVQAYIRLLEEYHELSAIRQDKPRDAMERLITGLGEVGAGPRDLLDVHVAALDAIFDNSPQKPGAALLVEARLLALEMMGLLVDYYRVGLRRPRIGRGRL